MVLHSTPSSPPNDSPNVLHDEHGSRRLPSSLSQHGGHTQEGNEGPPPIPPFPSLPALVIDRSAPRLPSLDEGRIEPIRLSFRPHSASAASQDLLQLVSGKRPVIQPQPQPQPDTTTPTAAAPSKCPLSITTPPPFKPTYLEIPAVPQPAAAVAADMWMDVNHTDGRSPSPPPFLDIHHCPGASARLHRRRTSKYRRIF